MVAKMMFGNQSRRRHDGKGSFEEKLAKRLGIKTSIKRALACGREINYLVAGNGPPLVLIHGLNIGWGQWYPNIPALSQRFRVYAINLPGSGSSTYVDYSSADIEEDYLAAVGEFILGSGNQLSGANVVGHSFGGWIALRLAARPELKIARVVAVSPLGLTQHVPIKFWPVTMKWSALLLATLIKPTPRNIAKITRMLARDAVVDDAFSDYYCESLLRKGKSSHPFLFINSLCDPLRLKGKISLRNSLSRINTPTMFVLGDRDPLLVLEKNLPTAELLPGAKINIFRNTGHLAPLERSQEFNSSVINFLS